MPGQKVEADLAHSGALLGEHQCLAWVEVWGVSDALSWPVQLAAAWPVMSG